MRRYKVIKELGDGTYGAVSLARRLENGELVAIKRLREMCKTFYCNKQFFIMAE
jgi:hypothetical protein